MVTMAERSYDPALFVLPADHVFHGVRRRALTIGGGALALSLLGWLINGDQFYRSWLVAYMFWMGPALGSLALLLLQGISGGRWGAALRSEFEAGARTLPLMLAFFLPILLGMHSLYEWTHADVVAHDAILQHKAAFLNTGGFIVRALIYFGIWIGLSTLLSGFSRRQDEEGHSDSLGSKMLRTSCIGILLYAGTMTLASVDWVMSITPHWFSHIYGVIFMGGQALTCLAFMIIIASRLSDQAPMSGTLTAERFHDFGKLLLAFTVLWAYFGLSQYLIMWAGNLPEEIPWYIDRNKGGWQVISAGLIIFHFALPFLLLLSRRRKRQARSLASLAMVMLVFRFIDVHWLIMPSFEAVEGLSIHWLDITTMAGVGGIWLWFFLNQLADRPLLPVNDPTLAAEIKL